MRVIGYARRTRIRPATATAAAVVLVLVLVLATTSTASSVAAPTVAQATALGQQAYLYGFPLLDAARVRETQTSVSCPDHRGDAPVNVFSNANEFANPTERTIVAPNVDTLYSIAHLDLGKGAVVLSHPNMGKRYFVFELLDPYTNVIGYIGTRTTGSGAGRFAITWTKHPGKPVPGAHVFRSPYRRVWIIGRTLARSGADSKRAYALMKQYTLTPPGGPPPIPSHCRPVHKATVPKGLAFFDALGRALTQSPPPARDAPLLKQLATIGVGPGLTPQGAHLPAAVLTALASAVNTTAPALPGIARAHVLALAAANHGWAIPASDTGDYGIDYVYRAGVASVGLGANTPIEAMYPTGYTDEAGQTLNGSQSYQLVFPKGDLPPARAFWSLTMYTQSGYLVPNPIHRYALGTTHGPLVKGADGSIVVDISHTRPQQPGVNWLPAPSGDFRLGMRLYLPRASALDGRWVPPPVTPVASVSASSLR